MRMCKTARTYHNIIAATAPKICGEVGVDFGLRNIHIQQKSVHDESHGPVFSELL